MKEKIEKELCEEMKIEDENDVELANISSDEDNTFVAILKRKDWVFWIRTAMDNWYGIKFIFAFETSFKQTSFSRFA